MMMVTQPEHFLESLRDRLIGRSVSYRRLACDSLLIYVECQPGDEKGLTIWFEPIWHLRGPRGVLVGSMQAAEASKTEGGLDVVCARMDLLCEKSIEEVGVHPLTHDLSVTSAGGYSVNTFVADPTVDESWHIRDNATRVRLKGCPTGLSIVALNTNIAEWASREGRETRDT